jgi:hypothetical protein
MTKRNLYRLELGVNKDCVIIYRTDRNLGRIGVYFKDKSFRHEYYSSIHIPKYIFNECNNLLSINN